MKFELNAGEKAKTLKVWEKSPTPIEIICETTKHELPAEYEFYVFRYPDRVELRQDLYLLSDRGAEKIEKLIRGSLTEVHVPSSRSDDEVTKEKPKQKKIEKSRGIER